MARDSGQQPALRMVRIRLPSGWTLLPQGEYVIGRDASCHIQLSGPKVSRRHARLRVAEGGTNVQDESSANGVFVNGNKLGRTPQLLSDGDMIMIGDIELEIAFSEQHVGRQRIGTDTNARATLVEVEPDIDEPSTTRASALDLLGSVAERAIATGDARHAESIMGSRLEEVLTAARNGKSVDPKLRQRAIEMALALARALPSPRWFDYAIDVLAVTQVIPNEPEWRELEATRKAVTGIDWRKLKNCALALEGLPSTLDKLKTVQRLNEWGDAARLSRR